ncbi:trypsin-like peptidase domain-containing protein [Pleurocapsales cyanobacterium LEGE 10410]|nr:trypsin-like peptidase domain-containing protein [Pleurocapsales cyanobacterium LEGE 10410]
MVTIQSNSKPLYQAGIYATVVAASVALTLGSLRVFPKLLPSATETEDSTAVEVIPSQASALSNNPNRNFVAAAVNRVEEAVVRIDTERTVATNFQNPFFEDPFYRNFFGEDVLPQLPEESLQQSQGSGFIIDDRGIILTNAHVVSGADKVTVTLPDGRIFNGEVRGVDELSDLAVVKIAGSDLPVAPLGNSSQAQVGQWAIAVGNPLGLDNTVTLGIISTLHRSSAQVGIADKRLDFIQTDTAINPGNSGGPLLNDLGEVIGINTAISVDAEGIGFAIPIDKAKTIKDRLANGEIIPHPYIGIQMLTLTPEVAQQLNKNLNSKMVIPEIKGVLVVGVVADSPAAKGNLRQGDAIVAIAGNKIETAEELQKTVEESQIGEPLSITVRRGEETQKLSVRPQELREAAN